MEAISTVSPSVMLVAQAFWELGECSGGIAGGNGKSRRQLFGPRRVLEL